ncbi:hypothetical protein M9X92_007376 [Pyricularia oryzae]|nr:hypothetical protein M9X92_007376 [Pyricularia oryzae]
MLLTHLVLGALAIISPASTYPTQTNRDPKYENAYPHISSAGGSIGSDPQLQPLIALEHFKRSVEAFFGSIAPEPHPTSADAGLAARDITTSRGPVKKRGQSAQAPANGGRKPAAPAVVKSSKSLAAKPPNAAALPKAATAPKAATLPKAATAPKAATVPKAAALPKAAAVPKGKNVAAAGTNKGSPGCLRKGLAKRTVVETSVNIDDTAMKNMIAVARRSDNSWRDGEGWAILAAWPPTGVMPVPEHYQLIAGYVKITSTVREEKDSCGQVVKIITTNNRQWRGYAYDIRAQNNKMIFIDRGESASPDSWPVKNLLKEAGFGSVSYSNLGPIKDGLTYDDISTIGKIIVAENPKYSYTGVGGHNCKTFAQALYKKIA